MQKTVFALLVLLPALGLSAGNYTDRYNEVFAPNGAIRPHYRNFLSRIPPKTLGIAENNSQLTPPSQVPLGGYQTGGLMGDNITVLRVPLVLSDIDKAKIDKGSEQIVRALTAFFADLVGITKIGRHGPMNLRRLPPPDLISEIEQADMWNGFSLAKVYAGKTIKDIRFLSGVDVARDVNGDLVVVEVNVGAVGGLMDKDTALDKYSEKLGVDFRPQNQMSDLEKITIKLAQAATEQIANTRVFFVSDSRATNQPEKFDMENDRIRDELNRVASRHGLQTRFSNSNNIPPLNLHGVAYWWAKDRSILLPEVLVNLHHYFRPEDTLAARKWLVDLFVDHNVPVLESPGTEILSNKLLLPWLEEIIRVYLGEEPILKVPKSIAFKSASELPPDDYDWVIKNPIGEAGEGVIILPALSLAERKFMLQKFAENVELRGEYTGSSSHALVQRYVPMSYIPTSEGDYQVEIRSVVYVNGLDDIEASAVNYGRASGINSNGMSRLNNVSLGAYQIPIIVMGGARGATLRPYNKCLDLFPTIH